MSCRRTNFHKKDNWLCHWLTLAVIYTLCPPVSYSVTAVGYPSAQQEHDMLILDALSRRSGTGYYGENSVMEMLSRSTNN